MHLVAFIIRIYHDARSPERQTRKYITILSDHTVLGEIFSKASSFSENALVTQYDGNYLMKNVTLFN